ncbi:glycosyltransferase involved in cell wall biosynthesis [Actinoplanes lutulentus]|uniref:Glycosyltransferase involved in cell wall biosynthesis n=1 Tax=Actinoplanes lutulentus TaxID=1287878 RepID=A0A327YZ53_9ACTN|nr:glycosyltransferase [Actinoplanes lutulentus]MBB2942180.1 glycosyltransferase involved in cell wall biosynthesis [Actinoplanes lutulentus]RAK26866.1 glycosyltransferase involved in cell wall biosynthesis [Actinoplanes lutulentus]
MNPTPSRERICLLTGGGYPYRRDALGGWCRTLVEGLHRFRFELLTVTDRELPSAPAYPLPFNVGSARTVALGRDDARPGRRRTNAPVRAATTDEDEAAALLCRGLLDDDGLLDPDGPAGGRFAEGLRRLAEFAGGPDPFGGVPLTEALIEAWRLRQVTRGPDTPPLPRLSVRDARTAAMLLRHAMRALAVELPEVELVHCVGGTTPLLAALAGRWRSGVPLLLTEARTPVPRQRPAEDRLSAAVRTVLRRFRSSVARTGYAEAELIAPLSTYHHGWALEHGARPARLVQVPAGVDPRDYPGAVELSAAPTVVWAGSGGPDSGLAVVLEAFADVAGAIPGTVLHLVGVTAAHEEHCAEQIERTGLGRAVRLHPLPADPRDRYAAGQVVAHVPGPADPPYRLVEAMMSGRAVVGVDIGPAGETLGDTGILVPPNDPAELAIAIVDLLRDPARRRTLGDAARQRALSHFTVDRVVRVYGALYTDLAAPPPAPAFELALAVAAPRTTTPATVRWLTRED